MTARKTIIYLLLALIVVILGALAGWYFFLRSQTGLTQAFDAARGFTGQGAASPFNPAGPVGASGASATTTTNAVEPPQLWHIAVAPAAGIGFATTTEGLQVRYAERASGYIFDASPTTGIIVRRTNTLMPKIYEATFADGDRVIERSLDQTGAVTTFAGTVTASSTALTGVQLPLGIEATTPIPAASQILYVLPQQGQESLVSANWDGTKAKTLFTTAVPGWRLWALPDGRTILAQKATDDLLGYAYTLKNGSLTNLVAPLPGLTILPRSNSSSLLYAASNTTGLTLFVQLSATTSAVRLPVATVADKCVWAPGGTPVAYCAVPQSTPHGGFLDAWYRGELHTSDSWWKVDARTGQAQLIFTPPSGTSLDVIDPAIDASGSYIAFLNNADRTPWLLRLEQ